SGKVEFAFYSEKYSFYTLEKQGQENKVVYFDDGQQCYKLMRNDGTNDVVVAFPTDSSPDNDTPSALAMSVSAAVTVGKEKSVERSQPGPKYPMATPHELSRLQYECDSSMQQQYQVRPQSGAPIITPTPPQGYRAPQAGIKTAQHHRQSPSLPLDEPSYPAELAGNPKRDGQLGKILQRFDDVSDRRDIHVHEKNTGQGTSLARDECEHNWIPVFATAPDATTGSTVSSTSTYGFTETADTAHGTPTSKGRHKRPTATGSESSESSETYEARPSANGESSNPRPRKRSRANGNDNDDDDNDDYEADDNDEDDDDDGDPIGWKDCKAFLNDSD
ncbi:MAG: hypothetical protein Q9169_004556, partial [Polycauliona sp. 2 TL-2023]